MWILEALCRAQVTSALSDRIDDVRGELWQRHEFEVHLARRHAGLQLPPYLGSLPPRLVGDAWIDGRGRLRRVTWRRKTYVRRPRWPAQPSTITGSQVVELWDFGAPVSISIPDLPHRLPGAGIVDIVRTWRQLSRRRREYEKPTAQL
jgi:hypothetical protein